MVSAFHGMNTLLRSLQSQQQAMDTTNHNIANANTEGYSRQTASMAATSAFTVAGSNRPGGVALQLGSGVTVTQVQRARDLFVDLELRDQSQSGEQWETLAAGLRQIEGLFNEPSDQGLQKLVSNYFNAWSDLSNNPESNATRSVVRAGGEALAVGFNDIGQSLAQTRQAFDGAVTGKVAEVNDLAAQVAGLNSQIVQLTGLGDQPNDLRDKRDVVLDRLVDLTGATYKESSTGSVTVLVGGRTLVNDTRATPITLESRPLASGTNIHRLAWSHDNADVTIPGGEIAGLLQLRDEIVPQKMRQLDQLASRIAGTVNDQHRQGNGIGAAAASVSNFFDPMTVTTALSGTGLANDLTAGTVTVGGQAVAVTPSSQTLNDVMLAITTAVEATPGTVPGSATWALDSASGKLSVSYTSTTQVAFGAPGDTSTLLASLGLQGAPTTVSAAGPPPTYTVTGLDALPLVSAARLSVDQAIKNDLAAIAAGGGASPTTGPGDNRNALTIAGLQRTRFAALGEASFTDFYAGTVAALGAETRQAEETSAHHALLTQHLEQRRESTSGVSLDEEATRIIQYQRAYQAAARGISALDEMLETIILRMGRVGN